MRISKHPWKYAPCDSLYPYHWFDIQLAQFLSPIKSTLFNLASKNRKFFWIGVQLEVLQLQPLRDRKLTSFMFEESIYKLGLHFIMLGIWKVGCVA